MSRFTAAVIVLLTMSMCQSALAQFATNKNKAAADKPAQPAQGFQPLFFPPQTNGAANINPAQNLTPQQVQSMMMMRSLQNRGRRGVQTGFPQIVPLGSPFGMMQGMVPGTVPYYDEPPLDAPDNDRNVAARKALEEKRQAEKAEKERKAKARKEKNKPLNDDVLR